MSRIPTLCLSQAILSDTISLCQVWEALSLCSAKQGKGASAKRAAQNYLHLVVGHSSCAIYSMLSGFSYTQPLQDLEG